MSSSGNSLDNLGQLWVTKFENVWGKADFYSGCIFIIYIKIKSELILVTAKFAVYNIYLTDVQTIVMVMSTWILKGRQV